MKPSVKDILQTLEDFAPANLAEKWDNVGLLIGSTSNSVNNVLVGLDPTNSLIDEALHKGADTIITHHPVIFKPLSSIHTDDPGGRLLQKALSANINIIACHTNLDSAVDGVNDVLAAALGLAELSPLQPAENNEECGLGRVGRYGTPLTADQFLERLFNVLGLPSLNIAGTLPERISTVALCGGSGSDFAQAAHQSGADVYLSAEIKHAAAIWANEMGFALIDGTHYATEKPAVVYLAEKLGGIAAKKDWHITIHQTETEKHPFVTVPNNIP